MGKMSDDQSIPINIVGDQNKINYSTDDFRIIRQENTCYVDKSKMIEDVLNDENRKVVLFTRPRRFGKSLNLSMLRYFFDMVEDTKELFKGLEIANSPLFAEYLNQYPVICLNFKNANLLSRKITRKTIADIILSLQDELYEKYGYAELKNIKLVNEEDNVNTVQIKNITRILKQRSGKDVIVLVDEYDYLINAAYGTKYWQEVCSGIKSIFGALFKSNEYLQFGVLSGVSRIGKELSFSDMNNLVVYGLTRQRHYEYFGFTEEEVKGLLQKYDLELSNEFYEMYNGYRLNDSQNMFNPVSILKFLDDYLATGTPHLNSYWVNAATNSILKDNVQKMNMEFRDELLELIDGKEIDEKLVNSIDYEGLDKKENILTLLIDTGYLCPVRQVAGDTYTLKVPNKEVLYGYVDMLESIVSVHGTRLSDLCKNLIVGKLERFEEQWNDILLTVSSFHDFSEKENSYHNLLVGALLYLLDTWNVKSNREGGQGRYDIAVIPKEVYRKKYRPILIEFKAVTARQKAKEYRKYSQEELGELAEAALTQIKEKKYYAEYGPIYAPEDFVLIGIGAQGKESVVRWA